MQVVLTSAPSSEVAQQIAEVLVAEQLAACVSILPGALSIYHWQGAIQRDSEAQMIIKSSAERFEQLCARICELHPYEVPEIIALPIVAGSPPYLAWLAASVAAD